MYLKKAEFNREPLFQKFRLREPFKRPILSADPAIAVQQLLPHDQFIIFASDGLWEHLTNQEAVDLVQNHPRNVRYLTLKSLSRFLLLCATFSRSCVRVCESPAAVVFICILGSFVIILSVLWCTYELKLPRLCDIVFM